MVSLFGEVGAWDELCYFIVELPEPSYNYFITYNEDIHNILDEFKSQPNWTTDCGVSCP